MRYVLPLTCMLLPTLCLSTEPLAFRRASEATYAIHTRYTVAGVERTQREAYLFKLEFQQQVQQGPIEANIYRLRKLDMVSNATKFSSGETVAYGSGGQLPLLRGLYEAGQVTGLLSPEALFKKPLLFPVLDKVPAALVDGTEWQTSISAIVLEEDVTTRVISGEMAISNLPAAVVSSRVVAHKTLNGRPCVQLCSTVSIRSEHEATAEYKIESYFDVNDGIPVMNIIEGNGTILDRQGQQKAFEFYSKEALVAATLPTD